MEGRLSTSTITRHTNIEAARGSLDSRRGYGHLTRILIIFALLLVLSIIAIGIFVSREKRNVHNSDPPIKHDLFTPPTMLA